jgi:hypothetical protein
VQGLANSGGPDRRSRRPDQLRSPRQTNLLALNATIEAAAPVTPAAALPWSPPRSNRWPARPRRRPRKFPSRSPTIQKVAGEAIDAIKGIGGIIGEVNEVATAIAAAVQEQGAATQEITAQHAIRRQGTKNVSDNITGVKTDADAAAAAADDVKHASETLETQSQQLGTQVTEFLGKIRAA